MRQWMSGGRSRWILFVACALFAGCFRTVAPEAWPRPDHAPEGFERQRIAVQNDTTSCPCRTLVDVAPGAATAAVRLQVVSQDLGAPAIIELRDFHVELVDGSRVDVPGSVEVGAGRPFHDVPLSEPGVVRRIEFVSDSKYFGVEVWTRRSE